MYYDFSEFYKRDVYFVYNEELNQLDWHAFYESNNHDIPDSIIYNIDRIDSYLESYDVLPTIGLPLVSHKFKSLFTDIITTDINFINAIIIDKKGNKNKNFYVLNILNVIPCLDENKSIVETKKYGDAIFKTIKKLYIKPDSLKSHSIVRMAEQESHIIVTKEFKERCENAKLKGFNFIEEGYSIYND